MNGTVTAVSYYGTVAMLDCVTDDGRDFRVYADPRMARDIEAALEDGEEVFVDPEPWQLA